MSKEWEEFLEQRNWAVGVDQDCKFFLYDVHADYTYDDEDLYWGHAPIACGYHCEKDIAQDYGFNI